TRAGEVSPTLGWFLLAARLGGALFPYATLFRSYIACAKKVWWLFLQKWLPTNGCIAQVLINSAILRKIGFVANSAPSVNKSLIRSEEHTSELQSRENLVCRLPLENNKAVGSAMR